MQRSIEAINAAVDSEDYERLLPLAREFAERNPQEPMGYAWQAMALIGIEGYEQALAATARAAQLGLDESEARILRAEAYTGMADYGGVIRELTPLVSNPEHRPCALMGRASALLEIGDLDQALDDANQAIAASPNEVAYVVRGNVYRARGELDKSIDDYNRADRLRPNSSGVLKKRSEVYELLGKAVEADRDLRAAEDARRLEEQTDKLMAEASAFLAQLRGRGVRIKLAPNDHDIEVIGGLKDDTIATLRTLKPQLLELLRAE